MKYYIYIIYSEKRDRYYIGYCSEIETRLSKHNYGATPSTRSGIPWKLVYYEEYNTKTEAIIREKDIKKKKSRDYIEKLINNNG